MSTPPSSELEMVLMGTARQTTHSFMHRSTSLYLRPSRIQILRPHLFLVPIRPLITHKLLAGVAVGEGLPRL